MIGLHTRRPERDEVDAGGTCCYTPIVPNGTFDIARPDRDVAWVENDSNRNDCVPLGTPGVSVKKMLKEFALYVIKAHYYSLDKTKTRV